jgi:type II secretory pathway pseudopilin PulG
VPLPARRDDGFSLAELIVALLVAIVILAVALPLFLRVIHSYQLSNAAQQVADILRQTRYQAIRLNKQVNCVFAQVTGNPAMISASMTDSSNNPLTGTPSIVLGAAGGLVDSGAVPGVSGLPTSAHLNGAVPTNFAATGGTIQFDARGSVISPPNISAFYLANPGAPEAGYRAVLLMPAGSLQIWATDTTGVWQEQR